MIRQVKIKIVKNPDLEISEYFKNIGFKNEAEGARLFKKATGQLLEDYIDEQRATLKPEP